MQFHYIRHTDRPLLWLNIAFLMLISLLPFTTSLIGFYRDIPLPYLIYGANLLGVGALSLVHWDYATKHHRLVTHDIPASVVERVRGRILIIPVVTVLAMVGAMFSTKFSSLLYLVLPFLFIKPGRVDQAWKKLAVPHEH